MPALRFITKSVEVEAILYTGQNLNEIARWTNGGFQKPTKEEYSHTDITAEVWNFMHRSWIGVKNGQYIVKGAKGEYYPIDEDTFSWNYDEIRAPDNAVVTDAISVIHSVIKKIREDAAEKGLYDRSRISTLEEEVKSLESSRFDVSDIHLNTAKEQKVVDAAQVVTEEGEGGTVPKEDFERNWKDPHN